MSPPDRPRLPLSRAARRAAAYVWAAPVSLAAVPAALLGAATGGRMRLHRGVLEASGGVLRPILGRAVPGFAISAITFGHVVLGTGADALEQTRAHERVHVRQYERWGALFLPLYLGASLLALARGRSVYGGNAFERQAERESLGEGAA
ncbi:MAG TPA: hypothetical protein VGO79_00415 [Thermoanaerobaculia bacterium]